MSVLRSRVLLCTVLGTITAGGASPGTGHERRLLAALLVWRRTVVSADRLTDVLWPDGAPPTATNTLQSKISRLRRLVGPGVLIRVGSGYVLELPEHGCDADRFTDLVAGADGLEPLARLAILDEALGLWTGRAYDDFADEDFARPAASGLEQRRLTAEEKRLEALLSLGHYDEVISAAEELIVEDPFRETFWAAEMEALHRSGRSVDALRCYTRARDRFIDETGLPPSTRLSAIEQTILLDERAPEPGLDPGSEPGSEPGSGRIDDEAGTSGRPPTPVVDPLDRPDEPAPPVRVDPSPSTGRRAQDRGAESTDRSS
ncbi:MAG: BTAD domain-containing putative transcriptional regulator, partial [Actinomycetota bacterium]